MQRLGKNIGKYFGETIDIRSVLADCESAAKKHGWTCEVFHQTPQLKLIALRRTPTSADSTPAKRLYISTGIHGDEPAGPMAALQLLQENRWPANVEVHLLPCLNPLGFTLNQREDANGIDLNRDYRNPKSPETRAHIAWLERQSNFDFHLSLHEDWESAGFYLYDVHPELSGNLAETVVEAVSKVCPIDMSAMIEEREAHGGIVRPKILPLDRPDWPEGFYLIKHKSPAGFTIEAPSDFPLSTRVAAEVAAVRTVLEKLAHGV
jgi:protein MpaA